MVVDDLHLLEEYPRSLALLKSFMQATQPQVKFLCASRHEAPAAWKNGSHFNPNLCVPNDALRLNRTEIAQLFNEYLGVAVAHDEINHLEQLSQGWLAALLLMGERMRTLKRNDPRAALPPKVLSGFEEIFQYFSEETFPAFAPHLTGNLLKLALLDTIDLPLAETLTGDRQIGTELERLVSKNLFVRPLDKQGRTFIFHSLLRDALLSKAQQQLSGAEIKAVLQQAGTYYLRENQPLRAIRAFLQAGDFATAEQVMSKVGMGLLAVNQTTTLSDLLAQIPAVEIAAKPWFNLFDGVLGLNRDPRASYSRYETARRLFVAQRNETGEMLTLAQLIHFHLYVDGRHNWGRLHLFRLEELFRKNRDHLDPIALMRFANAIAGGYCFFEYNAEKSDFYSNLAMEYARNFDLPNYLATARAVHCYRYSFFGNWRAFHDEMERALPLLANPRVSLEHKLALIMAQLSVLIMTGDFANYQRKKAWLLEAVGKNLASLSVVAPFLAIYDANMLIAQGKHLEAKDLLNNALNENGPGNSPHQCSQFLHFSALLAALDGNVAAAQEAAEESRRLRLEVGPGRFDALNLIILGAAQALIENFNAAEEHLTRALETVKTLREEHLTASAYFNRAYVWLRTDKQKQLKQDLTAALLQMKTHGYQYFFGWVPEIMVPLLQTAIDQGIEADYARKLAKSRLGLFLSANEPALPLLRFRVGGVFGVFEGDRQIASLDDFSAIQRQCTALLISAPGQCLSQEQLQTALWPDSPAEKARANFDTMLLRLRKSMALLLGPGPVKNYLVLQKGVLRLEHADIDIQTFREHAQLGLVAARKEEFWRAENHFHLAMAAWNGRPFEHFSAHETIDQVRFELESLFQKVSEVWARLLAVAGRLEDAVSTVENALKLNPTEHVLVKSLYQLNARAGHPSRAAKVIQNYRDSLHREDYLPAEIDEIIATLWNPDS